MRPERKNNINLLFFYSEKLLLLKFCTIFASKLIEDMAKQI